MGGQGNVGRWKGADCKGEVRKTSETVNVLYLDLGGSFIFISF